jgi:hypothetical protein
MSTRNRQKGTVAVFIAIVLPVLLAALGLVFDNGQAMDLKRREQKAADAAAIAAAQELRRGNTDTFRKVALENAELNGMGDDAEINIFNPPKTGKRAGDPSFVEVEVRHEAPLYFMRAFSTEPYQVEARAIAGVVPRRVCVLALNESASPGLLLSGNANVDLHVCGVGVNSDATGAARSSGGATLKAANIDVVGGYTGTGFSPAPLTGVDNFEDPLAEVPAPTIGNCLYTTTLKVSGNMTLEPGAYCGGITINGGGVANLKPGVYVLKGGLNVNGGGTIKGDEVMIYNTKTPYAPINFGGGAHAELSAPKTGTYAGILFFTDRTISGGKANVLTANSGSYFTGALYFPTTKLTLIGSAEMDIQKMLIIADTIEFQGNCTVTAPSAYDGLSPYILKAELVY